MSRNFPALVLNADFQPLSLYPLSTLNWQDAVKAVYKGTHRVVAEYADLIQSPSMNIRFPSVVALNRYIKPPETVAFTRFNVFLRDRFRCQYCTEKHPAPMLTFDHVVPRARGGRTTWDNISTCCAPCNTKKDCRTTMRPIRMPFEPTPWDLMAAQREFPPAYLHETWLDYLYWDVELEA